MTIAQDLQISGSSVSSCEVKTPRDESVGSIKELMFNTSTGEIDYVVLKVNEGFLNLGSKLLALPFESFEFNTAQDDVVIVKESKETLENAPGFDSDKWPSGPQSEFLHSMRSYYSEKTRSLNGRYDHMNRSFFNEGNTFDTNRNNYNSEGNNFDSSRNTFDSDRNTFGSDRNRLDSDRNNFDSDKNTFDTDRNTFGSDRNSSESGRNSFDSDRTNLDSDRNTFDSDRYSSESDRNIFQSDRNTFESNRNTFDSDRNDLDSDRKTIQDRQSDDGFLDQDLRDDSQSELRRDGKPLL